MSYQAEISRVNPTCFLFLIDQSSSMAEPIMGVQGNPFKAEFVSDALNRIIQNLVILASKDVDIRNFYDIGVIGYGTNVGSAFGGNLTGKELVGVDELQVNPLRVEERMRKETNGTGGVVEVGTKFPIWIDPVANGYTPMCQALDFSKQILENWISNHQMSYPPTVINLTDGEATDGDPRPNAKILSSLSTSDGNLILMTLHASSNQFAQTINFPNSSEGLPDDPSKIMYDMSSSLSPQMIKSAKELFGVDLIEGSRGFVYNGEIADIVQALDIGTRPAEMR